ncbi:hypothetical protein VD17_02930 [Pseudomonas fluorescens]|uniref:Uncharacterized protein n=1 Tax=Pseudomonas fluorescens TaxID=294 RepID=A0A0F4VET3_PSEFL|nr:hypothetical protein VD17_02930 [Pseudomonas fluorescens]
MSIIDTTGYSMLYSFIMQVEIEVVKVIFSGITKYPQSDNAKAHWVIAKMMCVALRGSDFRTI